MRSFLTNDRYRRTNFVCIKLPTVVLVFTLSENYFVVQVLSVDTTEQI